MATSDDISREYVEGCGLVYNEEGEVIRQEKMRVMSPLEIKQRLDLNIANTSENVRKRVLEHNAKSNGKVN